MSNTTACFSQEPHLRQEHDQVGEVLGLPSGAEGEDAELRFVVPILHQKLVFVALGIPLDLPLQQEQVARAGVARHCHRASAPFFRNTDVRILPTSSALLAAFPF